jgi:hypothetical protein
MIDSTIGRLMRTLCSIHVFDEVAPDVYTNNQTSAALVNNEPLRAYILLLFVPSPSPASSSNSTNILPTAL